MELERFEFRTPGGVRLAGVLHLVPGSRRGALICHGMMSDKESPKHRALAGALAERGLATLRFDFQGRGESPGDLLELTFARQVEEARAAVAELKRRSGVERVSLVGSSLGGAVALLLAAADGAAALATMAAVGRADLLGPRVVGAQGARRWREQGYFEYEGKRVGWALAEDGARTDLAAAAARVACPWLLLHGERDAVIPVSDAELLFEAGKRRARMEIVPGADHRFSDPAHQAEVIRRIADFLDEHA